MLFFYLFSVFVSHVTAIGLNGPLKTMLKNSFGALTEVPLATDLMKSFNFQPETLLDAAQLISHYGFPVEVHTVTTQDGYILTMQRIPGSKTNKVDRNLPPMLLVHGTTGQADNYLSNTPENSFPLMLAKSGFDVWLANYRGTKYSRGHETLNPNSPQYWAFSTDEIATFDMPANIDYILNQTGHLQLFYVGHSLGGNLPFQLCADKPEYNAKIKAIIAFAAIGNAGNASALTKLGAELAPLLKPLADMFQFYAFTAVPAWVVGVYGKYFEPIAREILFLATGPDYQEWNASRTEVHAAHAQSSTSVHVLMHNAQLAKKNGLRKYDWGKEINMQKYGQPMPPDYDLSKVHVPSYLYYGENDKTCSKACSQFLKDNLPNATMIRAGEFWNHVDFLTAKHAASVYSVLVEFLKTFA